MASTPASILPRPTTFRRSPSRIAAAADCSAWEACPPSIQIFVGRPLFAINSPNIATLQPVSSATIKDGGKKLILSKDGEDIVLNKITDKNFEKRKVAAQQPPAIPGLE